MNRRPALAPLFVVTFYSYKGGVGRSASLVNTAHQLARRGRKVLMLDFDLEAPGLHSVVKATWRSRSRKTGRGFTEFFAQYVKNNCRQVPNLDRYLSHPFGEDGRIQLLPAGNLEDFDAYAGKLHKLGQHLYERNMHGRELLLELRRQIQQMGFDYLLVDSRTGHSDLLGATTVLLPHLVIFVTNLSTQSIDGTRSMIRWVKAASDAAGLNQRPSLPVEDRLEGFFLRSVKDPGIRTMAVASPIPFGSGHSVSRAESQLGRPFDHVIYYAPHLASGEAHTVAKNPEDDPLQQYLQLAEKIQRLNSSEPDTLIDHGVESLSRQDWRSAISYFDAAEQFDRARVSRARADMVLTWRRRLGEVRALGLGFQTEKAEESLAAIEGEVPENDVLEERLVANLQLVRGLLASNRIESALNPAQAAVKHSVQLKATTQRSTSWESWELIARIQLGEVHRLLDQMEETQAAVDCVPTLARQLNRPIEGITALQLLSVSHCCRYDFDKATSYLEAAEDESKRLGVGYLTAGCGLVRGLFHLTMGTLSDLGRDALKESAQVFKQEGDGLSAANCLTEVALYRHRMGDGSDPLEHLQAAESLYKNIAGTALGQFSVLMNKAEVKLDRGDVEEALEDYRSAEALAKIVPHVKASVAETLTYARLFGNDNDQPAGDWERSRQVSNRPSSITRLRQKATVELLRGENEAVSDLEALAEETRTLGLHYEEALIRASLALAYKHDRQSAEVRLVRSLQTQNGLGWSVWSLVRNVSRINPAMDVGLKSLQRAARELLDSLLTDSPQAFPGNWRT